jgi:vacuolar-type H+-ATPase subunit I/STV1|tara:strand:+ start:313 stop:792 length:480 start_codon:yes stop_codon:yes gene_type:complete
MAEFEIAGMKFKGGKAAIVLTALSTLGGASWAAFEFYKDYMDMREIVSNIDVGVIEARNAVIETKLDEAIDYTRDIKNSLKDDITRIERVSDSTSSRVKDIQTEIDARLREVSDLTRETEKDVRDTMREVEKRIEEDMEKLETDLEDKLQKALDNPLAE